MPLDYAWLPLDGEVQLAGAPDADPMQQAKQAAAPTAVVVRAWSDGLGNIQGVHLSGPVVEKVGSGDHTPFSALFVLGAAGLPQNLAVELFDKAAESGAPQHMYGLRPLSCEPALLKEALASAGEALVGAGVHVPQSRCLLKEVMAIELDKEAKAAVGVDSLDTLLSIGFINAENIQDFVDHIPDLEETASKLASLVFATQLGLQSVSKTAAVRAMSSLEEVITGLRGLKRLQTLSEAR